MRTIYFYKYKSGVYFSTRLEWIVTVLNKVQLDFTVFASRWLTFNQLSNESFIYEVEKLPPASIGEISSGKIAIQKGNWFPEIKSATKENLFSSLMTFKYRYTGVFKNFIWIIWGIGQPFSSFNFAKG